MWVSPHFSLAPIRPMDSLHHVPPPSSLSALSRPELEALLVEFFGEVAALKQVVSDQREEIARLKGKWGKSVGRFRRNP